MASQFILVDGRLQPVIGEVQHLYHLEALARAHGSEGCAVQYEPQESPKITWILKIDSLCFVQLPTGQWEEQDLDTTRSRPVPRWSGLEHYLGRLISQA